MDTPNRAVELLEVLLWGLDILARPTFHNIVESFESWQDRHHLRPRLRSLARAGLVDLEGQGPARRVRLTPAGRLCALGGVDPVARWNRPWDGMWRLLLFDLRGPQQALRLRLWRWLRQQRFGYLQHSVWVSPDPVDDSRLPLRPLGLSAESYTVIEGRAASPHRDVDLTQGAWDFGEINRAYAGVIAVAREGRALAARGEVSTLERRRWLLAQREAWLAAVARDPLLPKRLCPPGYLGPEAWRTREETLSRCLAPPSLGQDM